MKVAVVGATGLVGQCMLRVLEEREFPITELIPVASPRSVGKSIDYKGRAFTIVSMQDAIAMHPDIALFSAGRWDFSGVGTEVRCCRNTGDRQQQCMADGSWQKAGGS